ncbi:MAG: zinc ribbon domain-containing protein [Candidatus Acidiferrales bacterium]
MITIENTGSAVAPQISEGVNGGAGANTNAPADTAATVTIASLSDQDWYISRTHGVYHIPACAKGQGYALLMITARGDAIDLGDNRRFPFSISAREIAEDLLQDLHDHGIFVCAGARPTQEEIAAATARRDAFYHQLVADGDTMWARGHSFREISDLHRRAAIALGIEREWAYVPVRMAECPACGEKVKPNVAVCRHCGAILDAEKAARHGLGTGVKNIAPNNLANSGVVASNRNDESISQRTISESSAAGGKSARGEAGLRSGK